jgi:hypothetical protein
MFQKVELYTAAIEAMGEEYQTESCFMALLIEQQKLIGRLETKHRRDKMKQAFDFPKDSIC